MISVEKAQEIIRRKARKQEAVRVILKKAAGRTLAEDIRAPFNMPPFDRAAMDGYALFAEDTKKSPAILEVTGEVQAGTMLRKIKLKRYGAVSIMTGAPLPAGADAVVMLEDVKEIIKSGKKFIKIFREIKQGENVSKRGEDFRRRQIILRKGKVIGPSVLAMLACAGIKHVPVIKKPSVGILSTGDELRNPGQKITPSQIYDCNSYGLFGQVLEAGGEPCLLGIARDNFVSLSNLIKRGLKHDILLISGGVSEGRYDLVVNVLKKLGVKPIFWKVAMKPGKPVFFGIRGKTLVFGLPGYPVSSYISFEILVRVAIARALGQSAPERTIVAGVLMKDVKNTGDRSSFLRVNCVCGKDENYVYPYERQKSGIVSSIVDTNGLLCLKSGEEKKKGTPVVVEIISK
jgi:molybdopterin molybdotransferase